MGSRVGFFLISVKILEAEGERSENFRDPKSARLENVERLDKRSQPSDGRCLPSGRRHSLADSDENGSGSLLHIFYQPRTRTGWAAQPPIYFLAKRARPFYV